MPMPGDIICIKNFEFEDGSKRDKLFIVLNVTNAGTPCLALKTTSQSKKYEGITPGCNSNKRVFFLPTAVEFCFKVDTYIQLPQIFEFSVAELITGAFEKQIAVTNSLPQNLFSQLKNCIKKFKNDISERHWQIIYKSK